MPKQGDGLWVLSKAELRTKFLMGVSPREKIGSNVESRYLKSA